MKTTETTGALRFTDGNGCTLAFDTRPHDGEATPDCGYFLVKKLPATALKGEPIASLDKYNFDPRFLLDAPFDDAGKHVHDGRGVAFRLTWGEKEAFLVLHHTRHGDTNRREVEWNNGERVKSFVI